MPPESNQRKNYLRRQWARMDGLSFALERINYQGEHSAGMLDADDLSVSRLLEEASQYADFILGMDADEPTPDE